MEELSSSTLGILEGYHIKEMSQVSFLKILLEKVVLILIRTLHCQLKHTHTCSLPKTYFIFILPPTVNKTVLS